jgi:Na+-translocating ferredoxin:NAD+ oxidoreductase RnfG subunit
MAVLDIFDRDDELRAAHQAKVKAERADKRAKYNRSESKLQKDIFDAIVKNGYLVVRVNSSVHMTEHGTRLASYRIVNTNETAGLSDGIVFHSHGAVFVEIKKPGGRLSEKQRKFMETCERYMMYYVLIDSVDKAMQLFPNRPPKAGTTTT